MIDKNTFTKKNISLTLDKHKVWLIIGISIAVLAILFLFLYSPIKGAIYGEAISFGGRDCPDECTGLYDSCQAGSQIACDDFNTLCGSCLVICTSNADCISELPYCVNGYCSATQPEICDNGRDDNGDGLIDCDDPDCFYTQQCQTYCDTCDDQCTNIDDLWTCVDCITDSYCGVGYVCTNNKCVLVSAVTPTCTDGIKNGEESDIDCGGPCTAQCEVGQWCWGNTDCLTYLCVKAAPSDSLGVCREPTEICDDTIDNDEDGLVDCDDSDCLGDPACPTCPTGQTLCNSVCVDIQTDPSNCGGCNIGCGTWSPLCVAGTCIAPTCGDGKIEGVELCDDGNMVLGDGCSATCSIEVGYSCSGSPSVCQVACSAGLTDCSGSCVDTQTSPSNCGACGVTCLSEQICNVGNCESPTILKGDADRNGCVSISELLTYIGSWKSGQVSLTDLLKAIGNWKNPAAGCT